MSAAEAGTDAEAVDRRIKLVFRLIVTHLHFLTFALLC